MSGSAAISATTGHRSSSEWVADHAGIPKAALVKVETELLRLHARECVDHALKEGTMAEKREKIVELVDLFERVR